jgi:uncharacterized Ntn-hydrolase superfamily protein
MHSTGVSAAQRRADGVALSDDGLPQYHFPLCAIDRRPVNGRERDGFACSSDGRCRTSRRRRCRLRGHRPSSNVARGLDLLRRASAQAACSLARQRAIRQVGLIDAGRSAAHTGKQNGNWAGGRQGKTYTVQANIMVGPEVVDAVATTFEATEGTGMALAERMILAMEAGYTKGGDRRWGNLQSAAIKIADPNDPGRGNDHIALAIEVGEHPEPVAELKRIYYTTGRRLGYRTFSKFEGADVIELKRMLHALGYWRPTLTAFPDPPGPINSPRMQELQKTDRAQYDKLVADARAQQTAYNRDYATFDDEAIAAVDKFRKDRQMDYQGDAPGLVDARFVAALRSAYFDKKHAVKH